MPEKEDKIAACSIALALIWTSLPWACFAENIHLSGPAAAQVSCIAGATIADQLGLALSIKSFASRLGAPPSSAEAAGMVRFVKGEIEHAQASPTDIAAGRAILAALKDPQAAARIAAELEKITHGEHPGIGQQAAQALSALTKMYPAQAVAQALADQRLVLPSLDALYDGLGTRKTDGSGAILADSPIARHTGGLLPAVPRAALEDVPVGINRQSAVDGVPGTRAGIIRAAGFGQRMIGELFSSARNTVDFCTLALGGLILFLSPDYYFGGPDVTWGFSLARKLSISLVWGRILSIPVGLIIYGVAKLSKQAKPVVARRESSGQGRLLTVLRENKSVTIFWALMAGGLSVLGLGPLMAGLVIMVFYGSLALSWYPPIPDELSSAKFVGAGIVVGTITGYLHYLAGHGWLIPDMVIGATIAASIFAFIDQDFNILAEAIKKVALGFGVITFLMESPAKLIDWAVIQPWQRLQRFQIDRETTKEVARLVEAASFAGISELGDSLLELGHYHDLSTLYKQSARIGGFWDWDKYRRYLSPEQVRKLDQQIESLLLWSAASGGGYEKIEPALLKLIYPYQFLETTEDMEVELALLRRLAGLTPRLALAALDVLDKLVMRVFFYQHNIAIGLEGNLNLDRASKRRLLAALRKSGWDQELLHRLNSGDAKIRSRSTTVYGLYNALRIAGQSLERQPVPADIAESKEQSDSTSDALDRARILAR